MGMTAEGVSGDNFQDTNGLWQMNSHLLYSELGKFGCWILIATNWQVDGG